SLASGIRRGKRSPDGNGTEEYSPHRWEYSQDPLYGPLLSRMDAYFAGLGVEGRGCKERVACEAAARPERFRPVADVLVKPLRTMDELERPGYHRGYVFRLFQYYWAASKGRSREDCAAEYPQCSTSLEEILDSRALESWQNLGSYLDVKLVDR
ncbi:unnamed protein product, partial [Darwinula stevensoni]